MFEDIAYALAEIAQAQGSGNKKMLIKKYAALPGFKDTIAFAFNPYMKTGIKKAKLAACSSKIGVDNPVVNNYLLYFKTHVTGSSEDVLVLRRLLNSLSGDELVASYWEDIFTKTLTIGASTKTINTVFPGLIPVVGCMLSNHVKKCTDLRQVFPAIETEKIDGNRRYIVKDYDGNTMIYTRSGKEDLDWPELIHEAKVLPDGWMYDGEIVAEGEHGNNLELRQATSSLALRKSSKTGGVLKLFDMVDFNQFCAGASKEIAILRKLRLAALFNDNKSVGMLSNYIVDNKVPFPRGFSESLKALTITLPHIEVLPVLGIATCHADYMDKYLRLLEEGKEGIMLNQIHGQYEVKRSQAIWKVKNDETIDLHIIGFEAGKVGGKYEHTLGNLVVSYKGFPVGVGSGLSNSLRDEMWNNQDKYLGKIVELKTFGETKDSKTGNPSLNCCIYKGIRTDKEKADA